MIARLVSVAAKNEQNAAILAGHDTRANRKGLNMRLGRNFRGGFVFICAVLVLVACSLGGVSTGLAAPPIKGKVVKAAAVSAGGRYVTIDFDSVDIRLFIKYISELTGKNFVVDSAVKGTVTIISPTKISVKEAYKVFESVLEVHGFATVISGSIVKIVPAVAARSKNVETLLMNDPGVSEDRVVTQLIPLKYADPNEVKKLFTPLVSKNSVLASYAPTGMLIVTDMLSNIKRLMEITKEIDVLVVDEEINFIVLQHASATTVATALAQVFQTSARAGRKPVAGAASSAIKIVPDERTNALIVLASSDDADRIRLVADKLDQELPRGEGDIHVYYLQNANAEDMAKVLNTLPGKKKSTSAGSKGEAPAVSADVQIVADKATNSMVITAKRADYIVLEDVIKKLDVPRKMVYIEALVMEVNVDKDFKLGAQWRGGGTNNGDVIIGGFSGGSGDNAYDGLSGALPSGISIGVLGKGITVDGITFASLGAMLDAYKDDSGVNIISTPQVLTTDNEEAEIKVGENVPYLTRQQTAGTTTNEYNTYEYKDVGVTLKITPQINQEGVVRLNLFQEVIKVKGGLATLQPTTYKRSAKTTVLVEDKNTVVIGGLIGEDVTEGTFKVPLLGDIPVLGWLFKSHTESRKKTNLFIFITPRIIRNPAQATEVYREKKDSMEGVRDGVTDLLAKKDKAAAERLADVGYGFLTDGKYGQAGLYLEEALALDPNHPYALLNMGVVREAEGRPADALALYAKLIALAPDERAVASTDATQQGVTLVAVARKNMQRLLSTHPQFRSSIETPPVIDAEDHGMNSSRRKDDE